MRIWVLRFVLLPLFLVRDVWRRLNGTGQCVHPLRATPFRHGPVAIVALYQNGHVRPDILALLLALRRLGVYVIAVNTGVLADRGDRLPVDCYVERRNFGRDFGSYRLGLRLLSEAGVTPARLLLFNDSVFYVARRLKPFLHRLLDSTADICSATDSVEVVPHQTSFCLSFSSACVASRSFRDFWRRYPVTDLRPVAILLGEIALSRRMRRAGWTQEVIAPHPAIAARVAQKPGLVLEGAGRTDLAAWSAQGNVTHRAPGAVMDLGVPLVKLDLVHRGALSSNALDRIASELAPEDGAALQGLLRQHAETAKQKSNLDRWGAVCGLS